VDEEKVGPADRIAVALAEFNALRTEITGRSTAQHGLLNLSLVATAAIGTVAFADPSRRPVLLVLPILTCIFGLLYFDHGVAIAIIGRYVRKELAPALREHSEWSRAMWWEDFLRHEAAVHRGITKATIRFDLPIILAFAVVPALATVYLATTGGGLWFWIAWLTGVFAEVLLVVAGVRATRSWQL
jgi:hypothetical protein